MWQAGPVVSVVAVVAGALVGCVAAQGVEHKMKPLPTERGEWWQYRGDRRLTGRSLAKGDIHQPAILWKHEIASRETLLAVTLGAGRSTCALPAADANPAGREWARIVGDWGSAFAWHDLEGTGTLAHMPPFYNYKVGKALPDVPGLQLVETVTKNYPAREPYIGTVRLKVRQGGQWVQRWEMDTDTLIWVADPILGDFDHDGRTEIALLPWYKLNVLDAATGQVKDQGRFLADEEIPGLGGRAYGWFGAYDLDNEGRDEFIIIDDFILHMEVMAWRDGKLQRLWLRAPRPQGIQAGISEAEDRAAISVNPEPVQDVDGDGRREIVVSIYNEGRDQRWHVLVLDGLTGKVKHDLAGWHLTGLRDADGDGTPELFCTAVQEGTRVPQPSALRIVSLKGGRPRTVWELADASFQTYDVPDFPPNVNSGSAMGRRTVLCEPGAAGETPLFVTRRARARGDVELTAWQAGAGGQIRQAGTVTGPRLEALGVRRPAGEVSGRFLVQATAFERERAAVRGRAPGMEVLASRRVAGPVSPAVVGRLKPRSAPVVLVQGANESIEAIRPAAGGGAKLLWRAPGRGMTCSNYWEGVLLADLNGDGRPAVLAGTRGEGDCARLSVLSADGKPVWHRDFERFPGTPPPWNVPGLMYWQAGYFRSPERMDVMVQLRSKGEETWLLDGRTGETVWKQSKGRVGRAFGGAWMPFYDYDGDGLEDIFNAYPDMFCAARGATGELLVAKEAREFVPGGGYWGRACVADLAGKGEPQVLFSNLQVVALLGRQGEKVWAGPLWEGNDGRQGVFPGIGDADGDGNLELFLLQAVEQGKRQIQCRAAATGELKWSLPMPEAEPSAPATADINGDGRDECLFTVGSTLTCVGAAPDGASGRVLWTLDLPAHSGSIAIADVLGSGKAQIVCVCADGYVYGIGRSSGP